MLFEPRAAHNQRGAFAWTNHYFPVSMQSSGVLTHDHRSTPSLARTRTASINYTSRLLCRSPSAARSRQ